MAWLICLIRGHDDVHRVVEHTHSKMKRHEWVCKRCGRVVS